MQTTLSELSDGLFRKLSQIVNGSDDQMKPEPNNFVTWCTPGLPFEARDFSFAAKGLGFGATAEEEKDLLQYDQKEVYVTLQKVKDAARQRLVAWVSASDRHATFRRWILALSCALTLLTGTALSQPIGPLPQLTGGTEIPVGELEAVGIVPGCTATLVGPRTVLTAAHCVCSGQSSPTGCAKRSSFTLKDVRPAIQRVSDEFEMSLAKWNKEVEAFAENVPVKRSQYEFAVGALTGVHNARTPMAVTSLSSALDKMLSGRE
ncbi:MAG: trypsin-like serine protease [Bryobacterales bacterium]|nr:trypsin-like serine protease [Bryobacterales bacterium]